MLSVVFEIAVHLEMVLEKVAPFWALIYSSVHFVWYQETMNYQHKC